MSHSVEMTTGSLASPKSVPDTGTVLKQTDPDARSVRVSFSSGPVIHRTVQLSAIVTVFVSV